MEQQAEVDIDYTVNETNVYLNQEYKKKGLASYHIVT